jgi:alginate O-acetyltransferase complex protein AlgI
LWHGAAWNFVVWGLYFAVLLVIEKVFLLKYLEKSKVISRAYTLLAVLISFVIFNATDMGEAFSYVKGMLFLGVRGNEYRKIAEQLKVGTFRL